MTTIEDLLRIVRENEEFRAALRRELLTDELLALPAQFAVMLETQNRMLADIAELRQTQNDMRDDLKAQHGILRRQQSDFGRFRGNYAISVAKRKSWDIAMLFARLRGARRMRERILTGNELSDMLGENYEAVNALNIRERAWGTFSHGDVIAEFTPWNGSGPGFYIAV